jgi:hypothetical protein
MKKNTKGFARRSNPMSAFDGPQPTWPEPEELPQPVEPQAFGQSPFQPQVEQPQPEELPSPELPQPEPPQQGFLPPPEVFQQTAALPGYPPAQNWGPTAPSYERWGGPYQSPWPQAPYQHPAFSPPPASPYQYPYATQGVLPQTPRRNNIGLVIAAVLIALLLCGCCLLVTLIALVPQSSGGQYETYPDDPIEGQVF